MQLLANDTQEQPVPKSIQVKHSGMCFPILFSVWAYSTTHPFPVSIQLGTDS